VDGEKVYFLTSGGAWRIPTPPPMKNHGNFTGSLSEMVRWLGEKAEALGVNVFTGTPADALLVQGDKVVGVRTTPSGLKRDGTPGSGYAEPTDLSAKVVVLSDGTRSPFAQAWAQWAGVSSPNPQIYALGVKEVWEVKQPLESVIHTMGWPLPRGTFGGSWFYPLGKNMVSIGLVAGLDARRSDLDVHRLLQTMKLHPLFKKVLEGGTIVEWGAKTIPEGGFYALPERRQGRGVMLLGDAAGFVDVAGLKGIHHAMHSGIAAAQAIFRALKAKDTGPRPRVLRRGDGRQRHDEAPAQAAQHAARVQERVRPRRAQGLADDRHVRHVPGLAHRVRERRGGGPRGGPADAVHARRQAHLQQGGRRVPVGQQDARRRAEPPARRPGRAASGMASSMCLHGLQRCRFESVALAQIA
jgi:flavin-dependent dehydrogenase